MIFSKKISAQSTRELYETDVLRKTQVFAFLGDSSSTEVNGKCIELVNLLTNKIESMDEDCCLPVIDVIIDQCDGEYSVSFEGLLGVAVNTPETRFYDRYFWYEFKLSSVKMTESGMISTLADIKEGIIEKIKGCESDGEFKCENPSDYFAVLFPVISDNINSYLQLRHLSHQLFQTPALYNDDIFENTIFLTYDPTSEYCHCSGNYEHFHNKKIRDFFAKFDCGEIPLKRYYLIPFVMVKNVSDIPDRMSIIKTVYNNEATAVIKTCFINNDTCRLQVNQDYFYSENHEVVISGVLFVQKDPLEITENERKLTAEEDSEIFEKMIAEFKKNDYLK